MRRRRLYSEDERRALLVRQGELTALAQHHAWPVLEAVLEERRTAFEREVAALVFGGQGMSLERQAFIRGFVKGMGYVLAVPTNAEARLAEILSESETEAA